MEIRLLKSIVDGIPLTTSGRSYYRDSDLKGFGLRVGTCSKVYFAEGKIRNRTVRVTIGKHGVFTTEQARNHARAILGQIALGINPNEAKREDRALRITLEDTFNDFLLARKNLAPLTVAGYKRAFEKHFGDWHRKPLTSITKDMIERRHRNMGEDTPAQANQSMRFLRSLFNFALGRYEDSKGNPILPNNPVVRLSQTRAWYRVERRQTVIKAHELEPWLKAVLDENKCSSPTLRDYLLLLILTGLRRNEGASLQWKNVDLTGHTLTITDTKNHENHTLPLSDFLFDLLRRRKTDATSEYVFPGGGRSGYIYEPRKYINTITKATGIAFTLHDLRRTFITVAESLDIPTYALKRLLNHKMSNDVTAGYIITDVERLRGPMQRITDFMLTAAKIANSTTTTTTNY